MKSSNVRMQDQYSEFQTRFFIFKHLVPMTSVDTCSFSCKFCFVATDLQNLLFEKYFLSSELHNIICGCRKDYICTKGSLFCAKIIIKCRFVPVFSLNISSAISLIFPSSVWCQVNCTYPLNWKDLQNTLMGTKGAKHHVY